MSEFDGARRVACAFSRFPQHTSAYFTLHPHDGSREAGRASVSAPFILPSILIVYLVHVVIVAVPASRLANAIAAVGTHQRVSHAARQTV